MIRNASALAGVIGKMGRNIGGLTFLPIFMYLKVYILKVSVAIWLVRQLFILKLDCGKKLLEL